MKTVLITGLVVTAIAGSVSAACGEVNNACEIGDRSYRIELPETPADGNPALIFMHGYGGSGTGALRNREIVQKVLDRGYAFVAPDGLPMREGRRGFRWAFRGSEQTLEIDFLNELREDLKDQFEIPAENVLLSGFSNGAFMTVYMACEDPEAFTAYATVAGGFWRPDPEQCAGPVDLHMTHGWIDPVVPLEGRILRGESRDDPKAVVQGDIFRTLEIFRETNSCIQNRPDEFGRSGIYMIRNWTNCALGKELEFALHPGGHSVPQGWVDLALDWFEEL